MKKSLIKQHLIRKHEDFISSIEDASIRDIVNTKGFITGGAIPSLLLNEEVNDYDYYFSTHEAAFKVAEYFVQQYNRLYDKNFIVEDGDDHPSIIIPSQGIAKPSNLKDAAPYTPIFLSENAITLASGIQLVFRFHGNPAFIHQNYDFAHTICYFLPAQKEMVLQPAALESILTKELIYTGSPYPLASIIRAKKFIKRGWSISASQYLKMCFHLNQLDLTDIETLRAQLTGVDTFYFSNLVTKLKLEQEKNVDFVLDEHYLFTVLEEIFDE